MESLEQRIAYEFKNPDLLARALTHSSFGYEHACKHNERLEFLGDSILGYVIARALWARFPDDAEGNLSKMKAALVSEPTLSRIATQLNIGHCLRLGKGEHRAGGRKKPSILADAMEAVIGAVAIDGGFEAAVDLITRIFQEELDHADRKITHSADYKTQLQEKLQEASLGLPTYHIESEEGPPHRRRFTVHATVGHYRSPSATGTSKKGAQQECAKRLLADEAFWTTVAEDPQSLLSS